MGHRWIIHILLDTTLDVAVYQLYNSNAIQQKEGLRLSYMFVLPPNRIIQLFYPLDTNWHPDYHVSGTGKTRTGVLSLDSRPEQVDKE